MKKNTFKTFVFILIFILVSSNSLVYANNDTLFDDNQMETRAATDGSSIWKIDSKTYLGNSYGEYRNGPQASNGVTASMSRMSSTSMSYQHLISGNFVNKVNIGSTFGVTFGKTYSKTSSFSYKAPKGKTIRIQYRPYYNRYKVVEREYVRLNGKSIKTNNTKISYVKIFQDWDCTIKTIK